MKIRKANIKDLERVEGLYNELLNFEKKYDPAINPRWPFSKFGEEHFKRGINDSDWITLVCENKSQLVGFLTGSFIGKGAGNVAEKDRETAKINHIYVQKEYREHGLGSKLAEEFKRWAKKKGVDKMRVIPFTGNEEAIHFYNEIGFKNYALIMEEEI